MKKRFMLLMAVAVIAIGAGCNTASEDVDEAVNTATSAVNETEEAVDAMEDKMEETEDAMEEDDHDHDDDDHSHDEEDTAHMMEEEEASTDDAMVEVTEDDVTEMAAMEYDMTGTLEDVSGGNGSGTASASYTDGMYMLYAEMEDIPELEEGYFYEGWVVRPEPFAFISTGEVTQNDDGVWVNSYKSETDYSEYTKYVLTLEPDDGDPAPADHILDGDMQ